MVKSAKKLDPKDSVQRHEKQKEDGDVVDLLTRSPTERNCIITIKLAGPHLKENTRT